jgi:hypothetical protein
MNIIANFEHRASSSRGKHEGESSFALCDRLSRTRDNSQRQLPTDHDYAVPTREYQTDQSSPNLPPAAARSVLEKKQRQLQKHPHRLRSVHTVTPYQANALNEIFPTTSVTAMHSMIASAICRSARTLLEKLRINRHNTSMLSEEPPISVRAVRSSPCGVPASKKRTSLSSTSTSSNR